MPFVISPCRAFRLALRGPPEPSRCPIGGVAALDRLTVERACEMARRFPPPWSARKQRLLHRPDANGQALTYVYFEEEPGRRAAASALHPASLPPVLIMASSLRPCAVHHSSSIEALGAFWIDTPVADKLLRHPVGAPFGSGRR